MSAGNLPLVAIAGPTASGKTALAVAVAKATNGEVICADSMQIYADLQVGTARPTPEETDGVPHRLFGFVPLTQAYSVAQYAADARRAIAEVHSRGKLPILCGGTGLYIEAILHNLQFADEPETAAIRARLTALAAEVGDEAMLARLREVDPETAAKLHPHNRGRVLRALEVFEATGRTMSEQQRLSTAVPSPYRSLLLVLDFQERQRLYDRIDTRAEQMLAAGLLDEARALYAAEHVPTAAQAIGYKELFPYLQGEIPLAEAVENLKRGTRRYAKRQLSWFRRMRESEFLYVDAFATSAALQTAVVARVEDFLHTK